MILAPWMRLVVACALLLWLAHDLGETTFRVGLFVVAVLWSVWAVIGAIGGGD